MNDAELLECIADILDAGARKSRGWVYNNSRQQDADVYEAMAQEARDRARALSGRHP